MLKKFLNMISFTISMVLFAVITLSVIFIFRAQNNHGEIPSIFGYKPMSVLTGSMMPLIKPGDLILVKDAEPSDIKIGDVITYWMNDILVTHRVIEVINSGGEPVFRTKGDANKLEDGILVTPEQLVGRLGAAVPYGGRIAEFAASEKGFVFLVVVPVFLLIGGELKTILSEPNSQREREQDADSMNISSKNTYMEKEGIAH